jgi:hypothetical protein
MPIDPFKQDDVVKTCPKLESGMFLGIDGIRSCVRGALQSPLLLTTEEIRQKQPTKELIMEQRRRLVRMLNDGHSEMDCKRCLMVEHKRYGDIAFSRLGHLDLQHYTLCNLRCTYCNYTRRDEHVPPQYDALAILQQFSEDDVEWNAHVDFTGGEPTLLDGFEDYLQFFNARRIRVLMYTNAVKFCQAIYDGLAEGSIYLLITSLDAGTPSTFKELRGRDCYLGVMENLSRYAVAGSRGKGMLTVKYIFCDSNCGDDDTAGFAYAMLALRPQQIWLTIDFSPLFLQQFDHDYSAQIKGYARLYLLLKKHGIEAFQYYKEAIAEYSADGRVIMNQILAEIEQLSSTTPLGLPDLHFKNFRSGEPVERRDPDRFSIGPLTVRERDGEKKTRWSLEGKRVLLVPATPLTQNLLADQDIRQADWIGFVDRNPTQQGKLIEGRSIYSYEEIPSLGVDVILVAPPEKHRLDILDTLARITPSGVQIAELDNC